MSADGVTGAQVSGHTWLWACLCRALGAMNIGISGPVEGLSRAEEEELSSASCGPWAQAQP